MVNVISAKVLKKFVHVYSKKLLLFRQVLPKVQSCVLWFLASLLIIKLDANTMKITHNFFAHELLTRYS